ncbi:MAG TPA: PH domain-containing protein, partial [Rudaea sp.]|nr:PH domain-containing protein [Rudaea sp.]
HSPIHAATPEQADLIGIVVVCALVMLLLALLLLMQCARVHVDQDTLIVHTGVGTKRIPLANLHTHGLRLVNFSTHPELRPVVKLWGTGLPGFAGGWFKLRNGDKAVCLLLDRHGISYLRSDADKLTVLLSLAEPEKLRALLGR